MRNSIERLVVLPFTVAIGCASDSTVSLGPKYPKPEANSSSLTRKGESKRTNKSQVKGLLALLRPSKCNISYGIRRFIRCIKKISHDMFAYKEDVEVEIEKEMEIGHPTDVKHVTHIGLDGSTTTNPVKSWDNNVNAQEIISFRPTISLKQFEQAMAAQTQNHQC